MNLVSQFLMQLIQDHHFQVDIAKKMLWVFLKRRPKNEDLGLKTPWTKTKTLWTKTKTPVD